MQLVVGCVGGEPSARSASAVEALVMRGQLFAAAVQPADTDERYTPPWIVQALGRFDLDPCSPIGGPLHGMADRWFSAADDGLAQEWHGRVWMNPPFSNAAPWADRFTEHGDGVALLPVSNAAWRVRAVSAADAVWWPADFPFVGVTHAQVRVSMPVMLLAFGGDNAAALDALAKSGRHPGTLLVPA